MGFVLLLSYSYFDKPRARTCFRYGQICVSIARDTFSPDLTGFISPRSLVYHIDTREEKCISTQKKKKKREKREEKREEGGGKQKRIQQRGNLLLLSRNNSSRSAVCVSTKIRHYACKIEFIPTMIIFINNIDIAIIAYIY